MGKKGRRRTSGGLPSGGLPAGGLPSVSILTPTTAKRADALPLLARCIAEQTYANIAEWVLVDGSADGERIDRARVRARCGEFTKCAIRWVEVPDGGARTIGALRQALNDTFSGDVAVCCDDDDYYPPTRVSHAVERLTGDRGAQIAGCTDHLVFNLEMHLAFQYRGFGPRHATNNTMAYTRAYARTHCYDISRAFAEENSFTNEFTEPMVQLDPAHAVVHVFHRGNTVDKTLSCLQALAAPDAPAMRVWTGRPLMSDGDIATYSRVLSPDAAVRPPDVAYYLGTGNTEQWSPDSPALGESERAVVHLSAAWAERGLTVVVYGDFDAPQEFRGVSYRNWRTFSLAVTYDHLILWRSYGAFPLCHIPRLRARRLIFDVHDSHAPFASPRAAEALFDVVALKSHFHRWYLGMGNASTVVIPSGARTGLARCAAADGGARDPKRCVWTSDYARGLVPILAHAWPIIREYEPTASLHVIHGLDGHRDELKASLAPLLAQPGVTEHGRRPEPEVARELRRSTFHLYYSATSAEIDGASIRESVSCGCLPLLSEYNVFRERAGLHIEGDPHTADGMRRLAAAVVSLMRAPDEVRALRARLAREEIPTWDETARAWIDVAFRRLPPPPPRPTHDNASPGPIHYINLGRRTDRRDQVETQLTSVGLSFVRREALTGADVPSELVTTTWVPGLNATFDMRQDPVKTYGMSPGERGCAGSHIAMWRQCVRQNSPIVVFEDDVVLPPDFRSKYDIICARMHELAVDVLLMQHKVCEWGHRREVLAGDGDLPTVALREVKYAWDLGGYIIWPGACARLLNDLPVNMPVDNFLAHRYHDGRLACFGCVPAILFQRDQRRDSDILHTGV